MNKHYPQISFIFFTIILFVTSLSYAQELPVVKPEDIGFSSERLQRIDAVFSSYVTDNKMAGSVILVSRRGKVGYFQAFGYRDIESKSTMNRDAIFRIASQTKAVISVAIMILQEEGKLLIQDSASKYIPEFKETTVAEIKPGGGYAVVKAERQITIRDLLNHTAGISYGQDGVASEEWKKAGIQGWYFADRDEPISKTIERMAKLPMDAQPGAKWVYGYSTDILGVIIERASGIPLDQFLKTRIFDPLGMADTYFYLPKNKAGRLATVYTPSEGQPLKPAPDGSGMNSQGNYVDGPRKSFSGGAGLLSTARDYYLFLQMLANGGISNGSRILSSRTVDLMTVNHVPRGVDFRPGEGFGLGFEVVLDQGERGTQGSVGEFGWGGAYGSTYWVDPAEELVVVYFTQLQPGSIVQDQLMLRALIYQALVD
ncbi:MAG: beta-lactamase family protein [Cyclobacteriaceae bacterium]|nr:beta-lactamase family protein [Cyclobacteriaceae bacterium]MDH4295150.1 beta-lactamase family protein [Cyclobacteriaceae bacterium]MDH5248576.1 beta-lactamase family protein [Cyclobacteriaceae bacterium]